MYLRLGHKRVQQEHGKIYLLLLVFAGNQNHIAQFAHVGQALHHIFNVLMLFRVRHLGTIQFRHLNTFNRKKVEKKSDRNSSQLIFDGSSFAFYASVLPIAIPLWWHHAGCRMRHDIIYSKSLKFISIIGQPYKTKPYRLRFITRQLIAAEKNGVSGDVNLIFLNYWTLQLTRLNLLALRL